MQTIYDCIVPQTAVLKCPVNHAPLGDPCHDINLASDEAHLTSLLINLSLLKLIAGRRLIVLVHFVVVITKTGFQEQRNSFVSWLIKNNKEWWTCDIYEDSVYDLTSAIDFLHRHGDGQRLFLSTLTQTQPALTLRSQQGALWQQPPLAHMVKHWLLLFLCVKATSQNIPLLWDIHVKVLHQVLTEQQNQISRCVWQCTSISTQQRWYKDHIKD